MAHILVDHLQSVFTPSIINDLARTLTEDPASIRKALDGLLPAMTSGIINRGESHDGAATLLRLLSNTRFDMYPTNRQLVEPYSPRQKAAELGNSLLRKLFPDRPERLAEALAVYSNLSPKSATTLTGLVMSVLMGFLHEQVATQNLTQAQLTSLLRGETDTVRFAIPTALAATIDWFIGSGVSRSMRTSETTQIGQENSSRDAAFPWSRWMLAGVGLLVVFGLLVSTVNRDKTEMTTALTDNTAEQGPVDASSTVVYDLDDGAGASEIAPVAHVRINLPNGRKLSVPENSFNYALAQFLATKGSLAPKLFTFDNLTFAPNSARITAKARPEVEGLIQIMQAYQLLTIRIEGHTDDVGSYEVNDPLSADRADALKAALVEAGITSNRISTLKRGYAKPVTSGPAEAGRQKNRWIDIVVTKL